MRRDVRRSTSLERIIVIFLRLLVGWHFTYEGLVKLTATNWSAKFYLLDSQGFLTSVFYGIANNETLLFLTDTIMPWLLLVIGICMVLSLFTEWAFGWGAVLLLFFYFSHPPVYWVDYILPQSGEAFLVNHLFIEMVLCLFLAKTSLSRVGGLDNLLSNNLKKSHE